jgi:uncharacterized SAM-binding protein YcdF (DUF218 family)
VDYLLSKLLPLLVYPLGVVLALVVLSVFATALGRRRMAVLAGSTAAGVLWLASTPWFAATLAESLQAGYRQAPAAAMPKADAIVVLGGILGGEDTLELSNLSDAVDRLIYAKRLFDAGKAPHLLLAGGAGEGRMPEADLLAGLVMEWGAPAPAILRETKSRNTRQNALGVRALLEEQGLRSVLLVTSALHMRRAEATLRAVGIDVIAAPTDFMGGRSELPILDWLPEAGALDVTTHCIKEYLGLWVYRWRGWAL